MQDSVWCWAIRPHVVMQNSHWQKDNNNAITICQQKSVDHVTNFAPPQVWNTTNIRYGITSRQNAMGQTTVNAYITVLLTVKNGLFHSEKHEKLYLPVNKIVLNAWKQ